ncbi:MAG: NADH-quinone oxidoreductase subunit C [Bacteroidetes bacterium]|nr:NADH-quinone oxidoreductase subunit C [Bacteroidota bacterium]
MNSQLTVKNIQSLFKICPLEKIQLFDQELAIVVKSKLLYDTLVLFKYHIPYQFNILTCITGADYPNNKHRFKLVYDLLSIRFNIRLRIKTFTHELFGIDSCHQLYFTAG